MYSALRELELLRAVEIDMEKDTLNMFFLVPPVLAPPVFLVWLGFPAWLPLKGKPGGAGPDLLPLKSK